jgi:hypothetical protein
MPPSLPDSPSLIGPKFMPGGNEARTFVRSSSAPHVDGLTTSSSAATPSTPSSHVKSLPTLRRTTAIASPSRPPWCFALLLSRGQRDLPRRWMWSGQSGATSTGGKWRNSYLPVWCFSLVLGVFGLRRLNGASSCPLAWTLRASGHSAIGFLVARFAWNSWSRMSPRTCPQESSRSRSRRCGGCRPKFRRSPSIVPRRRSEMLLPQPYRSPSRCGRGPHRPACEPRHAVDLDTRRALWSERDSREGDALPTAVAGPLEVLAGGALTAVVRPRPADPCQLGQRLLVAHRPEAGIPVPIDHLEVAVDAPGVGDLVAAVVPEG